MIRCNVICNKSHNGAINVQGYENAQEILFAAAPFHSDLYNVVTIATVNVVATASIGPLVAVSSIND